MATALSPIAAALRSAPRWSSCWKKARCL